MLELMAGVPMRKVASERKLPEAVVQEVFKYFNKMANE